MQTARHAIASSATYAEPTGVVCAIAPIASDSSALRAILPVAGVLVSGVVALLLALLGLVLTCPAAQHAESVAGLTRGATPTEMGG